MGKKVILTLEVEVRDLDKLRRVAHRNGYEALDEREAVVGAIVGHDVERFGDMFGLTVWSSLARWSPE